MRRVVRCRGAGSMWGAFSRKTLTHGSSPGLAPTLAFGKVLGLSRHGVDAGASCSEDTHSQG